MEGKEILRVAICEDSEMEQKRLLKIIEMGEYPAEPTVFGSGEAFLQEYHTGQFDVIFMDIYMNGMSGVDTVRSIREIDANVIIAFTTSSSPMPTCLAIHTRRYGPTPTWCSTASS